MTRGSKEYPDYLYISTPDEKSLEEYDTDERRAWIMDRIVEKGSPSAVNQHTIADKFGVSQQTICKDINNALPKSVNQHLDDTNKLKSELRTAYQTIKKKAMEEGDLGEYRRAIKDWSQWIGDIGAVETEPERIEMTHDIGDSVEELISFHKDDRGQDE